MLAGMATELAPSLALAEKLPPKPIASLCSPQGSGTTVQASTGKEADGNARLCGCAMYSCCPGLLPTLMLLSLQEALPEDPVIFLAGLAYSGGVHDGC